jgi:hypothetical protein
MSLLPGDGEPCRQGCTGRAALLGHEPCGINAFSWLGEQQIQGCLWFNIHIIIIMLPIKP